MAIKVPYTRYSFEKPPILGREEYLNLKEFFRRNPKTNIFPNGFVGFEFFKWFTIFNIILFSSFFVVVIFWGYTKTYIHLTILFLEILSGMLSSWPTALQAVWDRRKYYIKLKKTIICSQNYEDFLKEHNLEHIYDPWVKLYK